MAVIELIVGHAAHVGAVGIHDEDIIAAIGVGDIGDLFAVGRPDGAVVAIYIIGELLAVRVGNGKPASMTQISPLAALPFAKTILLVTGDQSGSVPSMENMDPNFCWLLPSEFMV